MKHKYILLIAALSLAVGASGFSASTYLASSRLADGKWIKIKTTSEGIFQLTYDQLRHLGFDNPERVNVFGYASTALTALNNTFYSDFPDDVQPMLTQHTADGRILFYGQGDAYIRSNNVRNYTDSYFTKVRSPYDTASYYFLSDIDINPADATVASPAASDKYQPLEAHISIQFIEPEVQNQANGGVVFHGQPRKPGDIVEYAYTIKDFKAYNTDKVGSFYYKFAAKSPTSSSFSTILPAELTLDKASNDIVVGSSDGKIAFTTGSGLSVFKFDDQAAGEDATFTFKVKIPSGSQSYVAEDFTMLRYPRANRLDDDSPFLVMNFPTGYNNSGQKVAIDGANASDLSVWSIDGYTPSRFDVADDASFVLNGSNKAAIAFSAAYTFPEPEIVATVDHQNIHATPTPDMVIITIADMAAEAEELAKLHRTYQGLDVEVFVHNDIYNEFSSGARDAMAFRRLAKMFYDRDPKKFRYLMFMGPTHYDNRSVSTGAGDRLVCYEQDNQSICNNTLLNYPCDAIFAMLDDNYNHNLIHLQRTQINVGRLSCITSGHAATYVAKVAERFANPLPAEVFNHVLLDADDGDITTHATQCNELRDTIRAINPNMAITPIYVEAFPSYSKSTLVKSLTETLTRGVGLMTYIGHGAPSFIDHWDVSDVTNTRYSYSPFVLFSSCDQFAFDHSHNGIVEIMMLFEEGGCLGGVAASRSVYILQNQKTCIPVVMAYAAAKPTDTYGDIFRRSRDIILDDYQANPNNYPTVETSFRNILAYNLAGDPALPIGAPAYNAVIDAEDGGITLNPLENNVITGKIYKDNTVASDYNGTVRIEVSDGKRVSKTNNINKESNYTAKDIVYDNEILAVGYGKVVDGHFAAEISIPTPTYEADSYRIVVSAYSEQGTAIGAFSNLEINPFDPDRYEEAEFDAPQILELYANDPTFKPGDEVTANTTLYALINPSTSRLNMMTANVNSRTRLTVDGLSPTTGIEGFLTPLDDGNLQLVAPITNLSEGPHTIELMLVNNAGICTRSAIEFIVSHRNLNPQITIAETPAATVATIDVDSPGTNLNRLIIKDRAGNTVFSTEPAGFPYEWDLRDNEGNIVDDGLYKASVLVQTDSDFGSTPQAEITVLHD